METDSPDKKKPTQTSKVLPEVRAGRQKGREMKKRMTEVKGELTSLKAEVGELRLGLKKTEKDSPDHLKVKKQLKAAVEKLRFARETMNALRTEKREAKEKLPPSPTAA